MAQAFSFASGYADGSRSIILGAGPPARGFRWASFKTAYQAGYERGRGDALARRGTEGGQANMGRRRPIRLLLQLGEEPSGKLVLAAA